MLQWPLPCFQLTTAYGGQANPRLFPSALPISAKCGSCSDFHDICRCIQQITGANSRRSLPWFTQSCAAPLVEDASAWRLRSPVIRVKTSATRIAATATELRAALLTVIFGILPSFFVAPARFIVGEQRKNTQDQMNILFSPPI